SDSFFAIDFWFPLRGIFEQGDVADVVFLISFSPITAIGNHFISGNRFKNINYLQQADAVCRAATNVESLSTDGVNVLPRCNECVYQIFHKENIADLFSVAKNGKLCMLYGIDSEM